MSEPSAKEKHWTRWLAVANLLVTVIVGIVIALYINHREEQLKLTLANRDDQLQRDLADRDEQLQVDLALRDEQLDVSNNPRIELAQTLTKRSLVSTQFIRRYDSSHAVCRGQSGTAVPPQNFKHPRPFRTCQHPRCVL